MTIEGNNGGKVDSINYIRLKKDYTLFHIVGFGVNGGATKGNIPSITRRW